MRATQCVLETRDKFIIERVTLFRTIQRNPSHASRRVVEHSLIGSHSQFSVLRTRVLIFSPLHQRFQFPFAARPWKTFSLAHRSLKKAYRRRRDSHAAENSAHPGLATRIAPPRLCRY